MEINDTVRLSDGRKGKITATPSGFLSNGSYQVDLGERNGGRLWVEAEQILYKIDPEFEDDISVSNEATAVQNTMVYVPNAFAPKGYNDEFKPISTFTDKKEYIFAIYNRWGEKLFETENPETGWDGTFEGEYVPVGVYVYYVKFLTSRGEYFEKRGSVTVVK